MPLVRVPRTLPKILAPGEVDRLLAALRTAPGYGRWCWRWFWAGCGAARCSACGWPMCGSATGALFVAEGKGGHQRVIPVAGRFLQALGDYLQTSAPAAPRTDRLFVVLKGPRRGSRCRPRAWMRSWPAPAAAPGSSTRPATSCATPA